MFRVEHGEAFQRCNLAESLVRGHECIQPGMMLHVQRHGKMECIQGSETLPAAISDNETGAIAPLATSSKNRIRNAADFSASRWPVRHAKQGRNPLGAQFRMIELDERAGVEEVVHRRQNRSSRSATIASDHEPASAAVIPRTSS